MSTLHNVHANNKLTISIIRMNIRHPKDIIYLKNRAKINILWIKISSKEANNNIIWVTNIINQMLIRKWKTQVNNHWRIIH